MDKIRNEEIRRIVNMQPAKQTANKNDHVHGGHTKGINTMAPTAPQCKALVIQPVGRRPGEGYEISGNTMYQNVTKTLVSRIVKYVIPLSHRRRGTTAVLVRHKPQCTAIVAVVLQ